VPGEAAAQSGVELHPPGRAILLGFSICLSFPVDLANQCVNGREDMVGTVWVQGAVRESANLRAAGAARLDERAR
jgi:hypothetical protein